MNGLAARITSLIKSRMTYQMIVLLVVCFALMSAIILLLLYRFQRELVANERRALVDKAERIANSLSVAQNVKIAFFVGQGEEQFEKTVAETTNDPGIVYMVFFGEYGDRTEEGAKRPPFYAYFKDVPCENKAPVIMDGATDDPEKTLSCRENDPSCYCADFPALSSGGTAALELKVSDFNLYGRRCLDVAVPVVNKADTAGGADKLIGWIRIGLSTELVYKMSASLTRIFLFIMLTLAVLGCVITVALHLLISRPIIRMAKATRDIGSGKFHRKIEVAASDELGQLGTAFNEMMDNIKNQIERNNLIIGNISDTVDHISKSTAEMFSISAQQSSGATEQAASVYEASSTSKEIAASANRIADTAEEVAAFARETSSASDAGKVELQNAIAQVRDVTEKSEEVAHRMVALGEQSQKIGAIIDIIKEISEQTNLLALNAAIEAAGAGESGRRFAVVAQEIRRLASRTLESTEVVREIVEEIQSSTNTTVMVTEQSMKSARESREIIENMDRAFHNIIELVTRTLTASTEITLSTRQQTTACEQMVATIMEVSDVASEVEKGAKESEEALKRLRELSDKLHELAVANDETGPLS